MKPQQIDGQPLDLEASPGAAPGSSQPMASNPPAYSFCLRCALTLHLVLTEKIPKQNSGSACHEGLGRPDDPVKALLTDQKRSISFFHTVNLYLNMLTHLFKCIKQLLYARNINSSFQQSGVERL
jgi:hypothetical protein